MSNATGSILFLITYTFSLAVLASSLMFYLKNRERMFYFFLFSSSIVLFLMLYSFIYISHSSERAFLFYKLSALGWLPIPFLALVFLLSLMDGGKELLKSKLFWLNALPLLPFSYWIIKEEFLATGFVFRNGIWMEQRNTHWAITLLYLLTVSYYIFFGSRFARKTQKKLKSKKREELLDFLITPLKITALTIVIFAVILPRLFDQGLPSITHFIMGLFYIYLAVLVFYNRVDSLETNSILSLVFHEIPILVLLLGSSGKIVQMIYHSQDFLFWTKKELQNSLISEFMNFPLNSKMSTGELLSKNRTNEDMEMIDKTGAAVHVNITLEKQYSKFGDLRGWLFIARDNRQMKSLKENLKRLSGSNSELRDLSIRDPLTGIFNRAKFLSALEREEFPVHRYGSDLSLIMLDIDHFKLVNDTYGHDVGDKVLCGVVDSVKNSLRESDLFSRWGGEEFIILNRNTNLEQASNLAERLRLKLSEIELDQVGTITASFGVSQYRPDDRREEILKRLDCNLYKAKETGRNRVVSDPPLPDEEL